MSFYFIFLCCWAFGIFLFNIGLIYYVSYKSEFLVIGTPQQISKISIDGVRVGSSNLIPSVTARNLGVYFDTNLTMETHVKNICKSTYYLLYNLRRIRKYFDQESMKLVVHALITSKLD